MSLETNEPKPKSKGQRIKEEVEARLSPSARERLAVDIVKDSGNLTKIRIRRIIPVRADGGTADNIPA